VQRQDGRAQRALVLLFLPLGHRSVGFQVLPLLAGIRFNAVLTRYYINALPKAMQASAGKMLDAPAASA
jgi:hypothetical protein